MGSHDNGGVSEVAVINAVVAAVAVTIGGGGRGGGGRATAVVAVLFVGSWHCVLVCPVSLH